LGILAYHVVILFALLHKCGTERTDFYYECTTGEEIDLSIQDEADTSFAKTLKEQWR